MVWVKGLNRQQRNYQSVRKQLEKMEQEKADNIFLTFNYTETLEEVYGINEDRVCHIHGKQGENILFGHGNTKDYTDEYMSKNIGSENSLSELDNFLKKDTKQAMKEHKLFLMALMIR